MFYSKSSDNNVSFFRIDAPPTEDGTGPSEVSAERLSVPISSPDDDILHSHFSKNVYYTFFIS
jgi:hypothetical protein